MFGVVAAPGYRFTRMTAFSAIKSMFKKYQVCLPDWYNRVTLDHIPMSTPRVLLLDDDDMFCRLMSQWIANHDIDADCVHTIEEAQAHLLSRGYDLMFVDLKLREGRYGTEFINWAKQRFPETPIVICTGIDEEEVSNLITELGRETPITILYKPFSLHQLASVLHTNLRYGAAMAAKPESA